MEYDFKIGESVRIGKLCPDSQLRGAVGRIGLPDEGIADRRANGIYWVEFEPWIDNLDGHPIEASEVDVSCLERLP